MHGIKNATEPFVELGPENSYRSYLRKRLMVSWI